MKASALIIALFALPCPAAADYLVTGQITAEVCADWLIFRTCSFPTVDAVREDGKLYTVATTYERVTDFNGQRCWITTKSSGLGLISWLFNETVGPQFLTKAKDGAYEEIDAEYITFPCKKTE